MKLVHLTDIHLSHIHSNPKDFGRDVASLCPDADAIVISGDISHGTKFQNHLRQFQSGLNKKVYFILGNHDYYDTSFKGAHIAARDTESENITWLTESGVIRLTDTSCLCGVEGWYDTRAGSFYTSGVSLNDFNSIMDIRIEMGSRERMREAIMHIADLQNEKARNILTEACKSYSVIYFATHVPPFPGATWHQGNISNPEYLPWFCNLGLGWVLADISKTFPEVVIHVLCGHTHSPGFYELDNIKVYTGTGSYGKPSISKVFEVT